MLVALIALFVALGGSAAALSGSNTVQSDDLGPGSQVTAPDVAANAVNGSDVVDNSLTGADILEPSLTGNARKLLYIDDGSGFDPRKIATVGPYTIKASCQASASVAYLHLYVNGPAGTADYLFINRTDDSGPGGRDQPGIQSTTVQIPANQDAVIYELNAQAFLPPSPPATFTRSAGTVMLRSGSVLVQLDLHLGVDGGVEAPWEGQCIVYGTGTRAT